jgi:hypothetical protein
MSAANHDDAWFDAAPFNWELLAGPLRHRLANIASPLGVVVELAGEGADISKLTGTARRCLVRLERTYTLLGALADRVPLPQVDDTVPFAVNGVLPEVDGLPRWLQEFAANAANAGATVGSLAVTSDLTRSLTVLTWSDDGAAFEPGTYFGGIAPRGEGGCGLGLAAVAAQIARRGGRFQARAGVGEKLRIILTV